MIDISETLEDLYLSPSSWGAESAREAASSLARHVGALVDWDADAGESWVSVILDARRVAMVSTSYPLAILEGGTSWNPEDVELVRSAVIVPSFDAPFLRCDIVHLGQAFGESERFHSVNIEQFSANDLWYATI
ncbi:hypothetical protein LX15_002698 [Streptoalloteichus tenebrarius]|uniref:Uncharacterized protein n=1 Tax=Streptoalloteichus tenebrarius (strain ATCC 17920 / DSM 40477 / JCM 4838 / CBS 697.72 / NBRC 16177 / NCIMB 11028 / NRRL B-12390 / A12253. 1 / ISP 5477) TaxID=1933 RepID=A0ABT1HU09_STRSD|nr:hypothetical protein [Streptoalloteichus tenebrarius]MCP2258999.1 hypothetical protein [Streptoalloteichus tenebrarius]BFF01210.1 hypothetical protein GCM10020241_28850 [Streptoalloteichus tenebrarius]